MATPPTFSSGAVLTAAQMNSVGLWLVKTQTIGTAVASVTVSDAFSADYDNYFVSINVNICTISEAFRLSLNGSTASYYSAEFNSGWTGDTQDRESNTASWRIGSISSVTGASATVEILEPFLARTTTMYHRGGFKGTAGGARTGGGWHNVSTSYSGIVISPGSGTMTGGTIRVYGYRN